MKYDKQSIFDLHVISPTRAWAAGKGTIQLTTDGGNTWTQIQDQPRDVFYDITFIDEKNGWALGAPGLLLQTTNGGDKWQQLQGLSELDLRSVVFSSATHGWVTGAGCRLLVTVTGGQTWTQREFQCDSAAAPAGGAPHVLRAVAFADRQQGAILLDERALLVSKDSGKTWRPQTFDAVFTFDVLLRHGKHLWLGGSRRVTPTLTVAALLRSDDGGQHWQPQPGADRIFAPVSSLLFSNEKTGYLAAGGTVYVTRDAGSTWTLFSESPAPLERLYGTGADNLWGLSRGSVYRYEAAVAK